MNDFTKEELLILLEGVLWRDAHINPNERPYKLHGKIQSMIDNYCEHEYFNHCCGCEIGNVSCNKCDRIIKNDN